MKRQDLQEWGTGLGALIVIAGIVIAGLTISIPQKPAPSPILRATVVVPPLPSPTVTRIPTVRQFSTITEAARASPFPIQVPGQLPTGATFQGVQITTDANGLQTEVRLAYTLPSGLLYLAEISPVPVNRSLTDNGGTPTTVNGMPAALRSELLQFYTPSGRPADPESWQTLAWAQQNVMLVLLVRDAGLSNDELVHLAESIRLPNTHR